VAGQHKLSRKSADRPRFSDRLDPSGPGSARLAARRMADQGTGGAIVNITSVAGLVGMTHWPAYLATKHGLIGLTKTMARDLAEHRIRVNAVAPGTVRTPLTEPYHHDEGTPADVARAVLVFVTDLTSWVTGTVLPVDGGWLHSGTTHRPEHMHTLRPLPARRLSRVLDPG
jgi:NAD(P)-dependent dehydrogenase (short-subunit alcohol dehydrogenase family)